MPGGRTKQPAIRHYAGVANDSRVALIRRDLTMTFGRDFLMYAITMAEIRLHALETRMSKKLEGAGWIKSTCYYGPRRRVTHLLRAILLPLR